MSNRIKRVNSLIKNELSQILLKEIDFPKDVLVTITRVETSVDLNQAKVYISVILASIALQNKAGGSGEQVDKILRILDRRIYDIQQALNKRLRMRPIPRIKFEKEGKTKEAARVEELLEEIKERE